MGRTISAVLFLSIIFICGGINPQSQKLWVSKDGSIRNVDTRAMFIDGGELYLATRDEVYRATDANQGWEPIFSLPSGANEIQCLGGKAKNILIGTRRGLFASQDRGRTWRNMFRTIIPEKNNILCIELSRRDTRKILIGTEKGIFLSEDYGQKWSDVSGSLKNKRVKNALINQDSIYACVEDGLYFKKDAQSGWERIYVKSAVEMPLQPEEVSAEALEAETENEDPISCIALKDSRLYIGVDKRILYSDDGGRSWSLFVQEGLGGTIAYITVSKRRATLYCATDKGIFEFNKEKSRWLELYKGMDKFSGASGLVVDDDNMGSIWALTGRGLYKLESGRYSPDQYIDVERNMKTMKIMFDNEPPFKELQQAAIRFAEVGPEKIANWRRESRLRAILPKVSVGLDNNRSTNSEIYTSATRDYVVFGPDDMSSGLDVSVSWELGDLIWSDDQTNIDVRSRLTTQLRNDILDDLRRAYYERKRLQFELAQAPPADIKGRFDRELRIQELTQAIDDLTGNYFSEHIKEEGGLKLSGAR